MKAVGLGRRETRDISRRSEGGAVALRHKGVDSVLAIPLLREILVRKRSPVAYSRVDHVLRGMRAGGAGEKPE